MFRPARDVGNEKLGSRLARSARRGCSSGIRCERELHADELGAGRVAGVFEEVGVNQPWAVVVVAGKDRVEERLLIREGHDRSIPRVQSASQRYNTPGSFGSTARSPRNDFSTSTTER